MFLLTLIFVFLFGISRLHRGVFRFEDPIIILLYIYLYFNYKSVDLENILTIFLILVLIVFSISDVIWGFIILASKIPGIDNVIWVCIDNKYRVSSNLHNFREILLLVSVYLIFYFQIKFELPYINFDN